MTNLRLNPGVFNDYNDMRVGVLLKSGIVIIGHLRTEPDGRRMLEKAWFEGNGSSTIKWRIEVMYLNFEAVDAIWYAPAAEFAH